MTWWFSRLQVRCSTALLRSSQTLAASLFLAAADLDRHDPRVDRCRGPWLSGRPMDVAVVGREGDEIGNRQRICLRNRILLGARRLSACRPSVGHPRRCSAAPRLRLGPTPWRPPFLSPSGRPESPPCAAVRTRRRRPRAGSSFRPRRDCCRGAGRPCRRLAPPSSPDRGPRAWPCREPMAVAAPQALAVIAPRRREESRGQLAEACEGGREAAVVVHGAGSASAVADSNSRQGLTESGTAAAFGGSNFAASSP